MLDLRRVDLHTHTYYSDGALSPYELVRLAKSRGIAALAVTDHDTVDGLPEAADAGEKFGVEVVNGVEMRVTLGEQELHLLGYFFDPENEGLRRHFEYFSIERKKRVERMVERLRHLGITLDLEKILARAGVGAPGRPHVAPALGEAPTWRSLFLRRELPLKCYTMRVASVFWPTRGTGRVMRPWIGY